MASTFFKRLKDKYGSENLKGKKYRSLVSEIIERNSTKVGRGVARLSNTHYSDKIKSLGKKGGVVQLPVADEVLPKRAITLRKAAQSGKSITQTLQTELQNNLRQTLLEHDEKGKPRLETKTGKINQELVKKFREKITNTFESRTKRDKKTGVPPNVKQIATTEVRSTINDIKENYNRELLKRNPGSTMMKTWLHNRQLSKKPRIGHMELNKKEVVMDEKFKVNVYNHKGKRTGTVLMDRPHDSRAPADEVIGCNCDIVYKLIVLREI